MPAYILIAYMNFIVFVVLFLYILVHNRHQLKLSISAMLICLSLGFWNFFNIFVYTAETKEAAFLWHKAAAVCMFLFPLLTLNFFISFTKNDVLKNHKWLWIIIYILPVMLLVHNFFEPAFVRDFVMSDTFHVWMYDNRSPSFWYYVTIFYLCSYFVPIFIILYRWQKNSKYKRERKIAFGFILIDSVVLIAGCATDLFLPLFVSVIPPSANLILLIFAAFLWFSIKYYHVFFIRHTPSSEKIFQTIYDPIIYTDNSYHIILANESAKRFFLSDGKLTGMYLPLLLPDYEALICSEEKTADINFKRRGKKDKHLMFKRTPVKDQFNNKTGEIFIFKDITLQVLEEEELREINKKYEQAAEEMYYYANYDVLTGLHNRDSFFKKLKTEKDQADQLNKDFSLIYLDLDGFKQINDQYGHNIGDIVLEIAAEKLKDINEENDFIARIGGDEFVILITDHYSVNEIESRIQKLKARFSESVPINSLKLKCNISAGVAFYSQSQKSIDALMHQADAAMYLDKKKNKAKA